MAGRMRNLSFCLAAGLFALLGCSAGPPAGQADLLKSPCTFALAPHAGEEPIDRKIRQLQNRVRQSDSALDLEQLGNR